MQQITQTEKIVTVGSVELGLEEMLAVARGQARVVISDDLEFVGKLEKSKKLLDDALCNGVAIYGVTTGYGGSCGNRLVAEASRNLGRNLIRYHGCGTGEPLPVEAIRAAMLARTVCLSKGYSGITIGLLQKLAELLNAGITPVVPCMGSVGASGDLTPMSYIASALVGDREVFYRGAIVSAENALAEAGIEPYEYEPKEPLAMINGTSVMTGIASLVMAKAEKILDAAIAATALGVHALAGHAAHYHPTYVDSKPHPGQIMIGEKLRALLASESNPTESEAKSDLQDPYSFRCSPQILGVAADAHEWMKSWVVREINSSNDNPLIEDSTGEVLMGGNFYGGHIAFAMDSIKASLASIADMLDRQMALLVDPRFSRGLPENLVTATGDDKNINHAFKGMQITASALTAEASKNTMPAAVFSRSTELHNQDKVSMGTIAARDADRSCMMVSRVAAIELFAAAKACQIRGGLEKRPELERLTDLVLSSVPSTDLDRRMDEDIETITELLYEKDLLSPA